MAWMTGAAIIGSSLIGSNAASNAGADQAAASSHAADLQNQQYQQTRQDQMPWLQAGASALSKLTPLAENYTPFDYNAMTADPGYAFRLSEGQKALDSQAAARGGLISGNALRAAVGYGQDMGSQEYQNAFNRYQSQRAAQLAPLQSLAGVGQTTAANLGAAGQTAASTAGNYLTSGAAANAAGQVGAANAYSNGLGTYLNYNQGNNLVSALNQNNLMSGLQTPGGIANYFNAGK